MNTKAHETVLLSAIDAEAYEPFLVADEPTGLVHWLRRPGADGFSAGIYRVEPGSYPDGTPVPYEFYVNETIHVIEGEVRIDMDDGSSMVLREGDIASFKQGSKSVWTFSAPFRKFFVEC
jgi:uncharacterized cupin superfamily protein